ncbi:MAG TPA: ATPase domain-containing protein [Pirellulales bacterium]|nr:ATPase domain-containing protein [Pirellulales bacterium]
MSVPGRLSTGVPGLDERLGGGLLPGTLTVVVGASGIGKTQLGLQFARAGLASQEPSGIIFDMNARIDPQSHAEYARRMFDWKLSAVNGDRRPELAQIFAADFSPGDYLHVFDRAGRRVTRGDVDFEAWHNWQAELAAKLETTIAFFYGNFVRGVRRVVVDGIEPAERASESIQFELFEYIYHQILRKDDDWVARDLLREHFRAQADAVAAHRYDPRGVACVLLYTSHETLLDPLISRPLADGELLATANTLILMGKIREGHKFQRGLLVAKHRGSAASDDVATFTIGDAGLTIDE